MLVEQAAGVVVPDPRESDRFHDMELILPIALIREHCKIDDVATVGNEVLKLYRQAAVETAEAYTGLLIAEKKWVTEMVDHPDFSTNHRALFFEFKAKHMFANPIGYYYGFHGMHPQKVGLKIGHSTARLPIIANDFGLGCCNPGNSKSQENFMYMAGYDCERSIPAAFKLGALKYIAHVVENAGDVVVSTLATGRSTGGLDASAGSNPALASGALEIWRTIREDAI